MVKRIIQTELYVDDLDGKDIAADELVTVRFTWSGKPLVLDLSSSNAAKFDKAIAKWVAAARPDEPVKRARNGRAATRGGRTSTRTSNRRVNDTVAIRAWAAENGYALSARGRIPAEVIAAYADANPQ